MRFNDDYDEQYPGQYALWEKALERAMSSPRGQQALRDLEAALLDLPQPRLIHGVLSRNGEVCTVGALALYRRRAEGRDVVLAELEGLIEKDEYGSHDEWEAQEHTMDVGLGIGLALTLAVDLAGQNDAVYPETPEERYVRVLAWTRTRILPVAT